MDWLANLGKDHMIVYANKKKSYTKKTLNIKEYKANYYIKNIDVYTERNRIASKKRSEERLNNLTNDETVYKLKYILEN